MEARGNRQFILLLVFGLAGIIGTGVLANFLLTSKTTGPASVRFAAEQILFFSFSAAAVLLLFGGGLVVRGRRVEKKFDSLIEQSRYRRLNSETDFRGFGTMGERLKNLYGGIIELNEKLGRKIGSQGTLLDLIVSNSASKMLVTDSEGTVLFISKGLLESLKKEKQEILKKPVGTVWAELVFSEIRTLMEEKYQSYSLEVEEYPINAYPIISSNNLVAYVLFNAEKRPFFYTPTSSTAKKKPTIQNQLSRILERGKRAPKGAGKDNIDEKG